MAPPKQIVADFSWAFSFTRARVEVNHVSVELVCSFGSCERGKLSALLSLSGGDLASRSQPPKTARCRPMRVLCFLLRHPATKRIFQGLKGRARSVAVRVLEGPLDGGDHGQGIA